MNVLGIIADVAEAFGLSPKDVISYVIQKHPELRPPPPPDEEEEINAEIDSQAGVA